MTTLIVPPLDDEPWPTLGPQVCDWIEARLVYGPGELAGQPYSIEPEFRALIYRMYEVFPQGHRLAGRRRFKRACWSVRKGTAKTEKGSILAIAESHPEAPVRADGFDAYGQPVGIGVAHPYIPLVAFSQDQTQDLSFAVVRQILEECELGQDYDIGLERILVLDGRGREAGKIAALGNSPNARDGARTTFQFFDETHRLYLPRIKKAHNVMLQNNFKRVGADAWTLETTTAFSPGEGSVAEDTMIYAEKIAKGEVADSKLFYFHRQAAEEVPMETAEDVRAALLEASGPAASWSADIDALVAHWFEPGTDKEYYRRVWLNQPKAGGGSAFDIKAWGTKAAPEHVVPDGELIVLGFDGSRRRDATALVAVEVPTGYIWPIQVWERPITADEDWEVPAEEVDAAVAMCFQTYDVWRLYGDPPYWDEHLDAWAGKFGDDRIVKWWTNRNRPMSHACAVFDEAIRDENSDMKHSGETLLARHIANAHKKYLNLTDAEDKPIWVIRKERDDSPNKIDACMAAILAWEARGDCVLKGMPRSRRNRKLYTF